MKKADWDCTALDPDPRVGKHLSEVAGVRTVIGDFFEIRPNTLGPFDVITFNKVLEHVEDPVAMLQKAAVFLSPGGMIYVEVPDVAAAAEGPGREEFFIEHHHVFSPVSLVMAVERAGFFPMVVERLREPSSKFTLRLFMTLL